MSRSANLQTPFEVVSPNAAVRWRASIGGSIDRSSDAGATWTAQSSGVAADLLAGASPSPDVCWLVGRSGTVLRTTDGGQQWRRVTFVGSFDLQAITAADASTGSRRPTAADHGQLNYLALAPHCKLFPRARSQEKGPLAAPVLKEPSICPIRYRRGLAAAAVAGRRTIGAVYGRRTERHDHARRSSGAGADRLTPTSRWCASLTLQLARGTTYASWTCRVVNPATNPPIADRAVACGRARAELQYDLDRQAASQVRRAGSARSAIARRVDRRGGRGQGASPVATPRRSEDQQRIITGISSVTSVP